MVHEDADPWEPAQPKRGGSGSLDDVMPNPAGGDHDRPYGKDIYTLTRKQAANLIWLRRLARGGYFREDGVPGRQPRGLKDITQKPEGEDA